jgi:pyridoxal 5'-phosphate synthase glutaminase subunit Pdx2
MPEQNGNKSFTGTTLRLKIGLAEMLKGGVIMDVMNVEQARIAEEAGATSVMALERVPAMIRAEGGVARMAKPSLIKQIIQAVSIPVMAKARIGHFAEAQILQELGVDFIDESEVLTPADEAHHIDKHAFTTPFVCGARNLGEALRRIAEGAAMIRTKGEAGIGVLAIQGDYAAHADALAEAGADPVEVRKPDQLAGWTASSSPAANPPPSCASSKSTTSSRIWLEFCAAKPVFGTCAGAILLAREVRNPPQRSLGLLDATVERNAYGRQIDSAILTAETALPGGPLEMVFIRAPAHRRNRPRR